MITPGGNGQGIGHRLSIPTLTARIISPGHHPAIGSQGQRMPGARRHGDGVRRQLRRRALPKSIVAPNQNRRGRRHDQGKIITDHIARQNRGICDGMRAQAIFGCGDLVGGTGSGRGNERRDIVAVAVRLHRWPAGYGHGCVVHIKPGGAVLDPSPHHTFGGGGRIAPRHGGGAAGARIDVCSRMGPPIGRRSKIGVGCVPREPFVPKITDLAGDIGDAQAAETHAHEHRANGNPTGRDTIRPGLESALAISLRDHRVHPAVLQHPGPITEIEIGSGSGEIAVARRRTIGQGRRGVTHGLTWIAFDGLDFRLDAGHQLVLEAATIIGPVGVSVAGSAGGPGVEAIASQAGTGIVGLAIRRVAKTRKIAVAIDFVVPVDAINRVVRH